MSAIVNSKHEPSGPAPSYTGAWQLAAAVVTIACFWCIALPWYASQPAIKEHLQFLDDRGIDPSAMFYTELDAMDAILEKIESDD
jgi:hypothetical protein